MATYFGKHNLSGTIKAVPGLGTQTLDVPFIPDYIKVEFHGAVTTSRDATIADDEVYWDLTTTTPHSYQLAIGWSVYDTREIYYRIARLTVDPV